MPNRWDVVVVGALVLASGSALAEDSGVSGTVTDVQGAALADVEVTLEGPGDMRSARTGADGTYAFSEIAEGAYRLRFERAGFRSVRSQVVVATGRRARLDVSLEIALIETVTVTAQRREESLHDVPLSVTALSDDALRIGGVSDVSRLQSQTPGLNFGRAGDDARPALRGARTENVGAVNDPVVGFHVDGVPRSRFSQALHPFVDLERVEVLRGPQGTLSGRNTFGGSINLVAKAPAREFDFGASGTLGANSRRRFDGWVNAPLGNRTELRVAGLSERRGGYVENIGAGPDIWDENLEYLRASLRVRPSDSVEVVGRFTHWDQAGNGQGDFGLVVLGTLRDPETDLISLAGVRDPVSPRSGSFGAPLDAPYRLGRDVPLVRDNAENAGSLDVTWRNGSLRLKSLTSFTGFSGFRQNDGDFSANVHAIESLEEGVDSFVQELQVASEGAGRLQWVGGAFYLHDDLSYRFLFDRLTLAADHDGDPTTPSAPTAIPSPGIDVQNLETVETSSGALFGNVNFRLTDVLNASAGLRWTRDEKTYSLLNELTGNYNLGFGGAAVHDLNNSWDKVTWRAGLDYHASPDHMLYGSVSTGFVAGGFAVVAPTLVYQPQQVSAYELGSKNQFGPRLRLDAAVYYADYQDLLANAYGTLTGVFFVYQTNAGSVTSKGIEIELEAVPVDRLTLQAHVALQDSKYDEFILPNPFPRGGDPDLPGNLVDLSGTQVQQQPQARFSLAVGYDIDLPDRGTLSLHARTYYSSEFNANDIVLGLDRVSVQPAYSRTDLRVSWTPREAHFRVSAFAENLENDAVLLRLVRGGENILQGAYAPPRTWGVAVSIWR